MSGSPQGKKSKMNRQKRVLTSPLKILAVSSAGGTGAATMGAHLFVFCDRKQQSVIFGGKGLFCLPWFPQVICKLHRPRSTGWAVVTVLRAEIDQN